MNPFPILLADLRAMRLSAAFIVVLIGLAVALGVAVGAQERALRQASARAAADFPLLIGAPSSQTQLVLTAVYLQPEALPLISGQTLNGLLNDPRVADAAPLAYGDVVAGYPVIGTTAAFVTRWGRLSVMEGRVFAAEGEAVVGADVKLAIGRSFSPSHAIAGERSRPGVEAAEEAAHRHDASLTVVGRLPRTQSPWDRAILIPVESVWETHGLGNGHEPGNERIGPPYAGAIPGLPAIVVKPRGVADAYQLRAKYRQDGTMALFPAEVLTSLYQAVGDIRDLLVVAAALNNVVVFLAIMLLLVTLAGLRRRRFAILRALGATRFYVSLVVWLTGATLVTAGCVLGLCMGWGAALGLSALIESNTGLVLRPAPGGDEALLCLAMVGMGWAMSLLVALLATRGDVVTSLRS